MTPNSNAQIAIAISPEGLHTWIRACLFLGLFFAGMAAFAQGEDDGMLPEGELPAVEQKRAEKIFEAEQEAEKAQQKAEEAQIKAEQAHRKALEKQDRARLKKQKNKMKAEKAAMREQQKRYKEERKRYKRERAVRRAQRKRDRDGKHTETQDNLVSG